MDTQLKAIVAQNLIELRKFKNYTQGELGEKLNYSDKTVSKWENGDSSPDLSVLCKIAEVYGITLDDLVHENAVKKIDEKVEEKKEREFQKRTVILWLSISVIFLIAALFFAYIWMNTDVAYWRLFIWCLPVSCLLLLRHGAKRADWKNRRVWIFTVLVWSLLLSVFLQLLEFQLWLIFIIGVPIQAIIILSSKLEK